MGGGRVKKSTSGIFRHSGISRIKLVDKHCGYGYFIESMA